MSIQIYSTDEHVPSKLTCFLYGASRVGKTHFAATFPKPVFLTAGIEGNETTLKQFKDVKVIPLQSTQDTEEAINAITRDPRLKDRKTVVFDSLTFYSDMFISEIIKTKKSMEIQDWQKLDLHVMKYLVPTLHSLGKHVVWIALEQEKRVKDVVVGVTPMMYGKAPQKVPATTNLICHLAKKVVRGADNKPKKMRVLELDNPDCTPIGARYGELNDVEWIEPHFNSIAKLIGKQIGEEVQVK